MTDLEKWKLRCFERDDGKCQITGDPAITVHHIIKRRFGDFLTDMDNGLCVSTEGHRFVEDCCITAIPLIRTLIGEERFQRLRTKFIKLHHYDYFAKWLKE